MIENRSSYADVKDAVIFGVLGAGMMAAPTTKLIST